MAVTFIVLQVRSANGANTALAGELPLASCFDSGCCPHDPEPSTSKEGLPSKGTGNERKDQTFSLVNGKCDLQASLEMENSSYIADYDSKESDKVFCP